MEYSKINTGDTFSLSTLFVKDNRIIIPDLQRDYCWGLTSEGKELVGDFVANIIENGYNLDENLNLGLIYGYETPVGHIQLCDGQQRITTLFLLLGLLNKKSGNKFQDRLISHFEYTQDDREPYLQYSIRESSLYFLSDLVCNFFIEKNDMSVSDIFEAPTSWYFHDYEFDPSIQSMLKAMLTIETLIKDVDADKLGEYICERLTFMYYDMRGRSNGEETFVVINTTGEPLSATENLKPRFVTIQANPEAASQKWEEWEAWFWKHRSGYGNKKNDTADNGFNEFFRWISLVTTTDMKVFEKIQKTGDFSFDVANISQDEVDAFFNVVKFLFEESGILENNLDWVAPSKDGNEQIVWFKLLPLIEYVRLYGREDRRNIIRVKTFFENLARIDNVKKSVADILPEAIDLIKDLKSADIAESTRNMLVSSRLLSTEERMKFDLYLSNPKQRIKMEDRFWKTESHSVWNGEIIPMLKWASSEHGFDFSLFIQLDDLFCSLFCGDMRYKELDIIRRALLTIGLNEYPKIFRGNTNSSFCWYPSDWQRLIEGNVEKIGHTMIRLLGQPDPYAYMESEMIAKFLPENDYAEFVHIPELLEFCKKKNIQWDGDEGFVLISDVKRSGHHANLKSYRLYLDLKSSPVWNVNKWKLDFYPAEQTCAYLDYKQQNLAIDIFHKGNDLYTLQLFSRDPESAGDRKQRLTPYAGVHSMDWNGERYETKGLSKGEAIQQLKNICSLIP